MTDTFTWDDENPPYNPITLLDGKEYNKYEIIQKMDDDSFYYGFLGKNAFSSSAIKPLLKGRQAYNSSLTKKMKETAALRDGKLIHTLLLEEDKFKDKYALSEYSRTTKKYKELVTEFPEKEVVLTSEYHRAKWHADTFRKNEEAAPFLTNGFAEVPTIGYIFDYPFRAKADYLKPGHIIDLKTTADLGDDDKCTKWCNGAKWSFHYDIQAFIYTTLFSCDKFTFLILEKETGEVAIIDATPEFIESGKRKLLRALDNYKKDPKKSVRRSII